MCIILFLRNAYVFAGRTEKGDIVLICGFSLTLIINFEISYVDSKKHMKNKLYCKKQKIKDLWCLMVNMSVPINKHIIT